MTPTRTRLAAALIAVVATLLGAGPAAAAKHDLALRTVVESPLTPGAPIVLVSHDLRFFESGGVTLECQNSTLAGTVLTEDAPKIELSIDEGSFQSPEAAACKVVEPQQFPIESELLTPAGMPWTAKLSSSGQATLAGQAGVTIDNGEEAIGCEYRGKGLRGTFPVTAAIPLVLHTSPPLQKLKLPKESACYSRGRVNADSATIAAEWQVLSNGQQVYAEIVS